MPDLVVRYSSSVTATPNKKQFDFVVPEETVQSTWAADVELAYDKYVAQFVTMAQVIEADVDPVWQAVTSYYAAFFAANLLLSYTGTLRRRIPQFGNIGESLWRIETHTHSGLIIPHVKLAASQAGGVGSHRAVWNDLLRLIGNVRSQIVKSSHEDKVLSGLAKAISSPRTLADMRNALNYNVEEGPTSLKKWSTLLDELTDEELVEAALLRTHKRDEVRFELVAVACGSLARVLAADHARRVGRADRRHERWRGTYLDRVRGSRFGSVCSVIHR